jgi:hypothetical protein
LYRILFAFVKKNLQSLKQISEKSSDAASPGRCATANPNCWKSRRGRADAAKIASAFGRVRAVQQTDAAALGAVADQEPDRSGVEAFSEGSGVGSGVPCIVVFDDEI